MKLAKGSSPVFALFLFIAIAFALLGLFISMWLHLFTLLFWTLFFASLMFFRDPERENGPGLICPADGILTKVGERDDQQYFSVFMNVHNVHVNRVPLDAKVVSVEHINGAHLPAFNKESERNERVIITLETKIGTVKMVQIAGIVARRIVPYVSGGEELKKGERIGLIRFGSRVDLYLPKGKFEPVMEEKSVVLAGISSLGRAIDGV